MESSPKLSQRSQVAEKILRSELGPYKATYEFDVRGSLTPSLLIRADADHTAGAGHLLRCLALAQAWRDRGNRVSFITSTDDPFLLDRLNQEENVAVCSLTVNPGSIEDARSTSQIASQQQASWIVVDGYRFGAEFQSALVDNGHKVLWIDDYGHAEAYCAQVVLNQNLHANESLYPRRDPQTRLLLGHRFILLRREFLRWSEKKSETRDTGSGRDTQNILVIAGGFDSSSLVGRILQTLRGLKQRALEIHCVADSFDEASRSLAVEDSRICLHTRQHDLSDLMAASHLAISAAGSTAWELAFMGVPTLLVSVAENQRPIAAELDRRGAAIDLGWHSDLDATFFTQQLQSLLIDQETRSTMASSARGVVDGAGVDRVIAHLLDEPLRLRSVRRTDRRLIWEWANDPEVRQASLSPEPIPWDDHVAWFDRQLANDAGPFWLALDETDSPVGHIRFEFSASTETAVHISINHGQRGRGHGSFLLEHATERLFRQHQIASVHAYIRPDNSASQGAFRRAGYNHVGNAIVKEHAVEHYIRERTT